MRRAVLLLASAMIALISAVAPAAQAQTAAPQSPNEAVSDSQLDEADATRLREAEAAIATLVKILNEKRDAEVQAEALRIQLGEVAEDDSALRKDLEAQRTAALEKVKEIEGRISALTTGATSEEFEQTGAEKFNLQSELENLARPFVAMLRSATETARQIELLRGTISSAERRRAVAERALERLELLRRVQETTDTGDGLAADIITEQEDIWRKRLEEVTNLRDGARQQLNLKMDEQSQAQDGVGTFVTDFIRTRGTNLVFGLGAFIAVFGGLRLLGRIAGMIQRRRGIARNFFTRLATLVFQAFTMLAALFAMLVVFNALSDWLLLGLTVVVVLALAWIGLKMIPSIVEQVTLLLNLGAVQEGERVMINGVPWRVERLDHYTDLVNPALEGGHFTVPVRELSGLHSRPAATEEAWFPTDKGDWLQLDDGRLTRVVIQTPELVQLEELGGARLTFATPDFIARVPRNLSRGYRVEVVFGIDYRHQGEAVDAIPEKLKAFVHAGLVKLIGTDHLRAVNVDVLRAGESSIDFEVEADVDGAAAHLAEDIEREMARLLIAACNAHDWSIPFPQMVLHRAEAPRAANGARPPAMPAERDNRPRISDRITEVGTSW